MKKEWSEICCGLDEAKRTTRQGVIQKGGEAQEERAASGGEPVR
jgi:hypothetical protein